MNSLHTSHAEDSVLFFWLSGLFLAKPLEREPYQHQRYLTKGPSSRKVHTVARYKRLDVKILEILREYTAIKLSNLESDLS